MKGNQQKDIWAYADWQGMDVPELVGVMSSDVVRGKEVFSFRYEPKWLKSPWVAALDPDLGMYEGPQYLREGKCGFGAFLDSSPDRWGRVLMNRREAMLAKVESRAERALLESDYLLGVYDEHRMGALRYKRDPVSAFQNDDKKHAAPPWTSLAELAEASLRLEQSDSNQNTAKWIDLLIAPGSSLGGARPKASVIDKNQNLWIAKFPSHSDDVDKGLWELLAYRLAVRCGITMSQSMAQKFGNRHHTFLTKRFDRVAKRSRIHFASAMTLLGYTDGAGAHGASYIELAEFIASQGANAAADLEQLWRRIVYSICTKNTDDHLRNHGFLLSRQGWSLSPAYDLNPNPQGAGLTLNISETNNSLEIELALDVSGYFRLDKARASRIAAEIQRQVADWKTEARALKISAAEQDRMNRAFC